jgi:hypothetical protein
VTANPHRWAAGVAAGHDQPDRSHVYVSQLNCQTPANFYTARKTPR